MGLFLFLIVNVRMVHPNGLNSSIEMLLGELDSSSTDVALFWNIVALEANANDADTSIFIRPNQPGPTNAGRALAIIHGAMYEAANVFYTISAPVFPLEDLPDKAGLSNETGVVAIMEAAYQILITLYPQQIVMFSTVRQAFLNRIKQTISMTEEMISVGIKVGMIAASSILKARSTDGSNRPATYAPVMQAGFHQSDPTRPSSLYLGANWNLVDPFIIMCAKQFLPENVVGTSIQERLQFLNSTLFKANVEEVRAVGARNNSTRTPDQTEIANFWAYEGMIRVGYAPRLYNQVARTIAIAMKNTMVRNVRLFALLNYVLADVGVSILMSKYYYDFWRPINAIRSGFADTPAEPNWLPMGAPADGNGDNFTPNNPSFISGHAAIASGAFETLRRFYGTDDIPFEFQSDEYNGKTLDSITGQPRPPRTRSFQNLTQAEMEAFNARIYAGIHWRIDQIYAQILGHDVARYIFQKFI